MIMSTEYFVKRSLHLRENGAQCVDVVGCVTDPNLQLADKHTDVIASESLRHAALRELDVYLTITDIILANPSEAKAKGASAIPKFYGYHLSKHRLHLLHEFCEEGDLITISQNHSSVFSENRTERHIRHTFTQICKGVSFLHNMCGVVHLDLSLENLLLTKDGNIRICDFGHSERTGRSAVCDDVRKVWPKSVGKKAYAAPELHEYASVDGEKADSWSLGVILYMLATRVSLLQVATVEDLTFCQLIKYGSIVALKKTGHLDATSPQLLDLLANLLVIDPTKRMSVDSALRHPWMVSNNAVRSSLRRTSARRRLSSSSSFQPRCGLRFAQICEGKRSRKLRSFSESNEVTPIAKRDRPSDITRYSYGTVLCG